jgi:hypothetical protein
MIAMYWLMAVFCTALTVATLNDNQVLNFAWFVIVIVCLQRALVLRKQPKEQENEES